MTKKQPKRPVIFVRVTKEEKRTIDDLASKRGVPVSQVIREMIRNLAA